MKNSFLQYFGPLHIYVYDIPIHIFNVLFVFPSKKYKGKYTLQNVKLFKYSAYIYILYCSNVYILAPWLRLQILSEVNVYRYNARLLF